MSQVVSQLLESLQHPDANGQKSSHWHSLTKNFRFTSQGTVGGISGFSGRSRRLLGMSQIFHNILASVNFKDLKIPYNTRWYKHTLDAFRLQSRDIDCCALRHVFTYVFLDNMLPSLREMSVCVIGDGQANFTSPALYAGYFKKLISINLPEVLISDWELLRLMGQAEKTAVVCRERASLSAFLEDNNKKFAMIPAAESDILANQPIDLFINIASFQEMSMPVINKYFEIVKSTDNGSILYCCNRSEKTLACGEVISFEEYPWEGFDSVLVDELAPWHQLYYTVGSRFHPLPSVRQSYDGPHWHRLVAYPPRQP